MASGAFGMVHKGLWHRSEKEPSGLEVAVKSLRNTAKEVEKIQFLQEAAIMGQFDHPYIIKIFGVLANEGKVKRRWHFNAFHLAQACMWLQAKGDSFSPKGGFHFHLNGHDLHMYYVYGATQKGDSVYQPPPSPPPPSYMGSNSIVSE